MLSGRRGDVNVLSPHYIATADLAHMHFNSCLAAHLESYRISTKNLFVASNAQGKHKQIFKWLQNG